MDATDEASEGAPTRRRSGRPLSAEEVQRRSLSKEARRLAIRIEEIDVSLSERESRITELETMFSQPDQSDGPAHFASAAEEYRVLKEEAGALWEEWEKLSIEAEDIDSKLAELKSTTPDKIENLHLAAGS